MICGAPVLAGLRVLEIGHYVAAPFCSRLLGDLGADVIRIEPLAGDPVSKWGAQQDGRSLWWSMHGRNKRSVAIDLKSRAARELVTVPDCASDPQIQHRSMVRDVPDPLPGNVLQAGIVRRFSDDPGTVRWAGPGVGQHTAEVLEELLGLDGQVLAELRAQGVIA